MTITQIGRPKISTVSGGHKTGNSDIESIRRRLEALEVSSTTQAGYQNLSLPPQLQSSPAALGSKIATGMGGQVGVGAHSKIPLSWGGQRPIGVAAGCQACGQVAMGQLCGDQVAGDGEDPSPADAVLGPLTDVLENLSIVVDPTSTSHKLKGMWWKPEYHVQHVKNGVQLKQIDHSKLTYRELLYGWFSILQKLQKAGGDMEAYIAHCKYVLKLC